MNHVFHFVPYTTVGCLLEADVPSRLYHVPMPSRQHIQRRTAPDTTPMAPSVAQTATPANALGGQARLVHMPVESQTDSAEAPEALQRRPNSGGVHVAAMSVAPKTHAIQQGSHAASQRQQLTHPAPRLAPESQPARIIQRVRLVGQDKDTPALELLASKEFSEAKSVQTFLSRFGKSALITLLDETWKDKEFYNQKALMAKINGEVINAKKEAQKERAEEEAPEIQKRLEQYALRAKEEDWKAVGWDAFAGRWMDFFEPLEGVVGTKKAILICRKLALVAYFDPVTATLFADRVAQLYVAKRHNAPCDWVGIKTTLEMVTGDLPGKPLNYSPFGGEYFDAFYGVSKQGGIPLSFKGITSELDAILSINPEELAEDEVVFSGSNYINPDQPEMNKNVDVSYIDAGGILHLIENGKDMNTLKNKAVGKHDQKSIYMHLAHQATSLVHTPVGGLTDKQAQRNQVKTVQWWYAIPPETINFDNLGQEEKTTLRAVAKAGAGLRVGKKRLLPDDLLEIQ